MGDVISGLWAALPTPLDADLHVDHAALVRHALWLLDQSCDGLVLFGGTGEGPSFTSAERLSATEALLKAGIPTGRIALGTGCTAIADTVALTRQAMALGLIHALILPPWHFREAPEEGIEDAVAAIIDGVASTRLRATLYNVPGMSGIAIAPAMLGRLRVRYGAVLAGVLDCSAQFANFLAYRDTAPACAALTGAEADIARARAAGGSGTISAMANIVPGLVRAMFDDPTAENAMRAACDEFAGTAFLPMLKAVLAASSGDAAWRAVRPPLRAAHPAQGARIAASLATLQAPRAA
jgi:4-hydroxy-tetrahydrodipicolinate synthase